MHLHLPNRGTLKRVMERMCVACALNQYTGDVTIHELTGLTPITLRLKNEH